MTGSGPGGGELPAYFGQGGRLKKAAHPALVASAYRHECSDAEILLPWLHDADLAHLVALLQAGVVPEPAGGRLMTALLRLRDGEARVAVQPALGDLYNSRDAALRELAGDDAGWIHCGRPRREALNLAAVLAARQRMFDLAAAQIGLGRTLLKCAQRHGDVLMTDFTYLHPAHPTTLGHYLLTFFFPMLRDLSRQFAVLGRYNLCCAGSGSSNGSALGIRRETIAELLGFEGIAWHTRDAMWQPDLPLEALSTLSGLMTNLDRMAEEFQIWTTPQFDLVDFDDSLFRASVIMPQKRNPYPMAYVRGVAGWLGGQVASFAALGKTWSGNPDSRIFIYGDLPRAQDKVTGAVALMDALVATLEPKPDNMRRAIAESFGEATDLAEMLMRENALDYRSAHQVVGAVARGLHEGRIEKSAITPSLLADYAEAVIGRRLSVNAAALERALDPASIVAARDGAGGASADNLSRMIERGGSELDARQAELESLVARCREAEKQLLSTCRKLSQ